MKRARKSDKEDEEEQHKKRKIYSKKLDKALQRWTKPLPSNGVVMGADLDSQRDEVRELAAKLLEKSVDEEYIDECVSGFDDEPSVVLEAIRVLAAAIRGGCKTSWKWVVRILRGIAESADFDDRHEALSEWTTESPGGQIHAKDHPMLELLDVLQEVLDAAKGNRTYSIMCDQMHVQLRRIVDVSSKSTIVLEQLVRSTPATEISRIVSIKYHWKPLHTEVRSIVHEDSPEGEKTTTVKKYRYRENALLDLWATLIRAMPDDLIDDDSFEEDLRWNGKDMPYVPRDKSLTVDRIQRFIKICFCGKHVPVRFEFRISECPMEEEERPCAGVA